jgi:hypothetical protein
VNKNQDALRVGGTVLFAGKDSIGVGAADGTIYWTEGNLGINFKELPVGTVVDVYYRNIEGVKYPKVVWVQKKGSEPYKEIQVIEEKPADKFEEIVLSDRDRDQMLETIEDPPEPNDALKSLMSKPKKDRHQKNKYKRKYEHGRNWK